jgi:F-type H+-transporting ATPase subunit delta
MESVIAEKYAVALLQVAKEQKTVETIGAEIQAIRKAMDTDPALEGKLDHPRLKAEDKIEALRGVLGRKLSATMENFLKLLILKKRVKHLKAVADRYESLCYEMKGKSIARVLTAMALTEGQKTALNTKLSQVFGTTVELREEIKPNLIGGMIIYLGDQRLDASVLSQLQKIRQRLVSIEID